MNNGTLVVHKRYGLAEITDAWYKLIDPVNKVRKVYAFTLKLHTKKGNKLFNKDRTIPGCENFTEDLPRCFESDLTLLSLWKEDKQ